MKITILTFCLLTFSLSLGADDSSMICQNKGPIHSFGNTLFKEQNKLKVLVWNLAKYGKADAFLDLKKSAFDADIFLLQEAVHTKNFELAFLSHFPEHQNDFYLSFCSRNQVAYGVQISSRLPSDEILHWPSPVTEPFSTIRKVSGYKKIIWKNKAIHIITTHALNFNLGRDFNLQIDDLVEKISKLEGAIIWAGDFNTWNNARLAYLLEKNKELGLSQVDFKNDTRTRALDHIFFRGLNISYSEIISVTTSDHDQLFAEFE